MTVGDGKHLNIACMETTNGSTNNANWLNGIKMRLGSKWTFRRGLYTLAGGLLLIQGVYDHQTIAIAGGAYFFAMGLFAFGCAGSSCGGACSTQNTEKTLTDHDLNTK
ncbi:MAG: hypothetical protein JPMHGGIA_02054 [Saprospiraceae bacterium]|jgi:hypothetical protein|nr:hypothetical protein [Saprospiraceae bacterium]